MLRSAIACLCVDNDEAKVNQLNQGVVPIHEEFLPELLGRHRASGMIQFTTDLSRATQESQVIFIAVGTPQSEGGNADLSYVDAVASEIARSIQSYKVIVEKSTVPVYTNDWIRRTIERNGVPRELFDVTSNPEFLREGTAVKDFLHPDRIVLGADSEGPRPHPERHLRATHFRQLLRALRRGSRQPLCRRSAADPAHLDQGGRNHQARFQCFPRHEDLLC